ncbi:MAG: ATP-binding protein [Mediterranea sp.]|jgi:energy-coupling factor transporter ATP-binding protein EcfA2|nr:ATP-binding protein [Mediterranea sp.]
MMERIQVKNFGPIKSADVQLGDLTILIGAQATGKSLFLELFKLVADKEQIISTLKKYNYIIGKEKHPANLLDLYFGEGMSNAWSKETSVHIDGKEKSVRTDKHVSPADAERSETIFYIPAQRILSISDGRPKNFMELDLSTPYVLRNFSETLRVFMQAGLGGSNTLFPLSTRLRKELCNSFNSTIFHDGKVVIDTKTGQRKMRMQIDGMDIPFMTWSAGQKEFLPLLMGFYCLSGPPTSVIRKESYQYVIIEEPEMGLHPQAVKSVLLQMLELVQSGYRVILSTHSSLFLEFAWTFQRLQESDAPAHEKEKALLELFCGTSRGAVESIFAGMMEKQIRTYYFARKEDAKVYSEDISSLDAFDENIDISEWGGLSVFATQTSDLVSRFSHE